MLRLLGVSAEGRDFLGASLFDPTPQVIAFRDGSGVQGTRTWLSGGEMDDGQCHGADDCTDLARAIRQEPPCVRRRGAIWLASRRERTAMSALMRALLAGQLGMAILFGLDALDSTPTVSSVYSSESEPMRRPSRS